MQLIYLIDADGFEIDNVFLVKELAVAHFDSEKIDLYCYKVGEYRNLSKINQRRASWVTRHIHGLAFDSPAENLEQDQVLEHLSALCVEAEKQNKRIGYKGGHYELDFLRKLGYGHLGINIESLGCPKLERLFDKYPESAQYQCSNHAKIDNTIKNLTIAHCPKMEVYCFRNFVLASK